MTIATKNTTLAELYKLFGDNYGKRLRVAMPARVTEYYPEETVVDVKPLLMQTEINPETEEPIDVSIGIVTRVPLVFPGAGNYRITFPVQKDDTVLLVIADHCIEEWFILGDEQPTKELRTHHISDAIAIVGLTDSLTPWHDALTESMTMGHDTGTKIEVQEERINLSLESEEQFILGTTYRQKQADLHANMRTKLSALSSALSLLQSDMVALATASTGTLAPLAAGFTSAAGHAVSAAQTVAFLENYIATFEASTDEYLSEIVYGK